MVLLVPKADIAAVLSLFHKNKEIIVIFGFYCVLLWRFLIKRLSMTIKEYFEGDRFAMDAGIIIDEIKEGYALLHMTVDERHLNGAGWCQGGAIFTLADLAFACATNSRGVPTVTVAANITLLRPVAPGTRLTAEARETFDHKTLPFAEVRITDDTGQLMAVMTSSGYRRHHAPPLGFEDKP